MKLILAGSLVVSSLLFAIPANAQGTVVAPQKPISHSPNMIPGSATSSTTMKTGTPKAERTAKSLECSTEADKQGLHGKARKSFRKKCKHGQT